MLICLAGAALAQTEAETPAPAAPAPPAPAAPAPAAPAVPAPAATAPAAVPAAIAPAAKPDASKAEAAGTPATVIDGQQIEGLLGKTVESPTGEDMGHIVDVLVDKTGLIRGALIDFGGFFGVGNRKIAIEWQLIRFPTDPKSGAVMVDLPRNQLRVAPVYKDGEPVVILGRPPAGAAKAVPDPIPPADAAAPAAPAAPAPAVPAAPVAK